MEIKNIAQAGTVESNDIFIRVSPFDKLEIQLESTVLLQYEEDILNVIKNTLKELNITSGLIEASDKGALDYTIKSRVKTAVLRSEK